MNHDTDQFSFRQQRKRPLRCQFRVKVVSGLLEQDRLCGVGCDSRLGEERHVPVQALVVVLAIEELDFLECGRGGDVGLDGRVHGQEGV